ncbi:MAG: hypothetical protein HZB92_06570 [Euryarchaeota archaeon]|nr:hypothetical protein [Euryarchaeota archaeon]
MKSGMNYAIVTGLIVAAVIVGFALATIYPLPPPGQTPPLPSPPGDNPEYYTAKTVISFVNLTLLGFLIYVYASIYRQVRTKFTIGLITVMLVLFLYALTSNPLIQILLGFRAEGLGPFAMIPDLFASVALTIMAFLSVE